MPTLTDEPTNTDEPMSHQTVAGKAEILQQFLNIAPELIQTKKIINVQNTLASFLMGQIDFLCHVF